MDARLIPLVLPIAKKVHKLEHLKEEFKRVDILLNFKYPEYDDSLDTKIHRKPLIRYLERLAENISKLEKELYHEQRRISSSSLSES